MQAFYCFSASCLSNPGINNNNLVLLSLFWKFVPVLTSQSLLHHTSCKHGHIFKQKTMRKIQSPHSEAPYTLRPLAGILSAHCLHWGSYEMFSSSFVWTPSSCGHWHSSAILPLMTHNGLWSQKVDTEIKGVPWWLWQAVLTTDWDALISVHQWSANRVPQSSPQRLICKGDGSIFALLHWRH